ncbi:hypothetical protein AB0P36_04910 [Streptomyces flavidovirens]|uniref:hypothetical protein n=1 Tax=Streptomyces flavidovirens TaxID=67298 RepID=UPI0034305599
MTRTMAGTMAGTAGALGCAAATRDGVRCTDPSPWTVPGGVRIERPSPDVFRLSRDSPGSRSVYYRVGYGHVEWGEDLGAFLTGEPYQTPGPGQLLALIHGTVPSPDATLLPGVQRLAVGTTVRVDSAGVTVTRQRPELAEPGIGVAEAVGRALDGVKGDYAIAYSGGLSSAFLAVSALAAGHRPVLLHADFGGAWGERPPAAPPPVPGLEIRYVPVDPAELFAHEPVSGREPVPPLPDTQVPLRLMDRLSESCGLPVVSGGLLKDLASARLSEADTGYRGWRLLGCEPFHITDTSRGLAEARELLSRKVVFSPGPGGREAPGERLVGKPARPRPAGAASLPGLTQDGEEALSSSRHGMLARWKDHLDFLDPASGRVVAGLEERGAGGALLPALDPQVIAAVAALRPARLGRIHRGAFRNHLPLERAVRKRRVYDVCRAPSGHWLRLGAVAHLHRERGRVHAWLERESALADLGVLDVGRVLAVLRDGRELAEHALPMLRLVWVCQWLRGLR